MKILVLLILLSLLVAPKAFAGDDLTHSPNQSFGDTKAGAEFDEERKAIKAWLSHHHQLPTRAELERLSENAREIVFEIARDEEVFLFHRHRALYALAHWADGEVFAYLTDLLADEATEDGLRHHLLPILADGFGLEALDVLAPFLRSHRDPQIRISAAAAIANIAGEEARQLLLQAYQSEEHPLVKSRIESYATQIR